MSSVFEVTWFLESSSLALHKVSLVKGECVHKCAVLLMRGISHFLVSYKLYVPPADCYHRSVLVLGVTMDVGPILSHHRKTRYLTKEHPGSPTLRKWKCNHKWSPLIVYECVSVMRLHFFLQLWFFKFFHKVLALGKATGCTLPIQIHVWWVPVVHFSFR